MRHYRSRIHLLAAREASTLVVLQRKRNRLAHVITIDTRKNRVTEGSWFRGRLFGLRSDLSFDGKHMVYLAMGPTSKTWSGICRPPWLTTLIDVENFGTWYGGGFFESKRVLRTNNWGPPEKISNASGLPFKLLPFASRHGGEDLGVIYERFARDGFKRLGDNWGKERKLAGPSFRFARDGDDGWSSKPSRKHPALKVRYAGYFGNLSGYTFAFSFDEFPDLLKEATWATWDADGNLWVAKPGTVEKFTPKDLRRGKPSFSLDVDRFEPPAKPERERATR